MLLPTLLAFAEAGDGVYSAMGLLAGLILFS